MDAAVKPRVSDALGPMLLGRIEQSLGWTGIAGAVLVCASALLVCVYQPLQERLSAAPPAIGAPLVVEPAKQTVAYEYLPDPGEAPTLLSRIERVAVQSGLGWPKADYQHRQATSTAPASLEVKIKLEGSYPNVRRFLADVIHDVPSLTIRSLQVTRTGTESASVQANVALAIFFGGPEQSVPTGASR